MTLGVSLSCSCKDLPRIFLGLGWQAALAGLDLSQLVWSLANSAALACSLDGRLLTSDPSPSVFSCLAHAL